MNKLLITALAALCGLVAVSPALAEVAVAYQAQVNNRTVIVPVTQANPLPGVQIPATAGGLSTCRVVTGTTGFCKASAGQAFSVIYQNTNAAVRYLHLYSKASAPTLSTDTPILTIPMALTSVGNYQISDLGVTFPAGIAWAITTDDAAIPVTAGTSGDGHFTISYK